MNFEEYQKEAIKTMKTMSLKEANTYFALKIQEEAAETASILTKNIFHDKPIDKEKLLGELGDAIWYIANLAEANGIKFDDVATYNIEKLRKRHGEKYNQEFYKNK